MIGSFSFKAEKSGVCRHFEKRGSISKPLILNRLTIQKRGLGEGEEEGGAQG